MEGRRQDYSLGPGGLVVQGVCDAQVSLLSSPRLPRLLEFVACCMPTPLLSRGATRRMGQPAALPRAAPFASSRPEPHLVLPCQT